jgi:acetyl-CoA carboxylase carboxyl transferase subunit alpha
MANNSSQDRLAYDFELPVVEVEKRIRELTQQAAAEEREAGPELQKLQEERARLLAEITANLTAYQRVRLARHPARPQPTDYVRGLVTDFLELHGDRRFGDDHALVTGPGRLNGHRIMVVAMNKGKETREKVAANFGMPQPEGYRKALHKMKLAEKFGLPVVCLIDTPGAACTVEAEERGQAMAIAESIFAMTGLAVPIVVLVTGEGCSGGALGVGVGDRFAMLENAYYSVMTPEGCASILWKDGSKAAEVADAMKLTARDMLDAGIIDDIIAEPVGGAHRDPQAAMQSVRQYLSATLDELQGIPVERLLEERYARYRRLGAFDVAPPVDAPEPA